MPPDRTIRLDDGRILGWADYGDPSGRPLMYFHGWPSSRLEAEWWDAPAREEGVRVISIDRPGIGLSTHRREYRFEDWPRDVAALARALGFERFAVVGVSAGAPYAIACAYHLADTVAATGVVSGAGPSDMPDAPNAIKQKGQLIRLARRAPRLAATMLRILVWRMRRTAFANVAKMLGASDQEIIQRQGTQFFRAGLEEAVRQGARGPIASIAIEGESWGFRLEDVKGKVYLWHGEEDHLIPPAVGRYIAKRLPNCQATFCPGEGHYSTAVNRAREIIGTLCGVGQ